MMPRYAFLDPAGLLKAHGFVETNEVGQTRVIVPDDFDLPPNRWRHGGSGWEAVAPVERTPAERDADLRQRIYADPLLAAIVATMATLTRTPEPTVLDAVVASASTLGATGRRQG